MKRMYSKEELVEFLKNNSEAIIEALNNQDISIAGLTSKGIANTGGFANIGDVAISGNLDVQGEGKGEVTANKIKSNLPLLEADLVFPATSGDFSLTPIYCKVVRWNNTLRFILSLKITNNGASAQTIPLLYSSALSFDEEIASKIIDVDGKTLAEDPLAPNETVLIRGLVGQIYTYTGVAGSTFVFTLRRYNKTPSFVLSSSQSIPAGETRYMFAEMTINL